MGFRWEIGRTFEFSAAHHLEGVEEDHPCRRVHGHNYRVTVTLAGTALDSDTSMLVDYRVLKEVVNPLIEALDHRDLNEVLKTPNPTAELLAMTTKASLEKLVHDLNKGIDDPELWVSIAWVEVRETDRTFARVYST